MKKYIICGVLFAFSFLHKANAQVDNTDKNILLQYWAKDAQFSGFSESIRSAAAQNIKYTSDLHSCAKHISALKKIQLLDSALRYLPDRLDEKSVSYEFKHIIEVNDIISKIDNPDLKTRIAGNTNFGLVSTVPVSTAGQSLKNKYQSLITFYANKRKDGLRNDMIIENILVIEMPDEYKNLQQDLIKTHPNYFPTKTKKTAKQIEEKINLIVSSFLEFYFWDGIYHNAVEIVSKEKLSEKSAVAPCNQLFSKLLEEASNNMYDKNSVVGSWSWSWAKPGGTLTKHGSVTFMADGTMTWDGGSYGTWTQSGVAINLKWKDKNYNDIMTLTGDGKVLSGVNNVGWQVEGRR